MSVSPLRNPIDNMPRKFQVRCLLTAMVVLIGGNTTAPAQANVRPSQLTVWTGDLVPTNWDASDAAAPADASAFLANLEIEVDGGAAITCTGVAISPSAVVTQGHCLTDARSVSVTFFKSRSPLQAETIDAWAWRAKPAYSSILDVDRRKYLSKSKPSKFHDIGLVVLAATSEFIQPLPQPPTAWAHTAGDEPVFAGDRRWTSLDGLPATATDRTWIRKALSKLMPDGDPTTR